MTSTPSTRRPLSLIDLLTGRDRIRRLPARTVGPRPLKHDARPTPRDDTFIPRTHHVPPQVLAAGGAQVAAPPRGRRHGLY